MILVYAANGLYSLVRNTFILHKIAKNEHKGNKILLVE